MTTLSEMTSLSEVPEPTIRSEARILRKLLEDGLWGITLRKPKLGPDESSLIRAFWETVGWCEELEAVLGPPEIKASRKLAKALLVDYHRWKSPLKTGSLPEKFRVVEGDTDGVGFAVTDETTGLLDPRVVGFSADSGLREVIGHSYLRWCAGNLLFKATNGWYSTRIECEPPISQLGESPLPNLSPGTRKLAEGLWAMPADAGDVRVGNRLHVERFDALGQWLLRETRLKTIQLDSLPGASLALKASAIELRGAGGTWREIQGVKGGEAIRVGRLDDTLVVIELGEQPRLAASPREWPGVMAAMGNRGWA